MKTLTRAGLHALIIMVVSQLLAAALQARGPGFQALFAVIGVGGYLPFALITSVSMHELKAGVLVVLVCIVIALWPINDVQTLSAYLLPIGCGILAGQCLRSVIREERQPIPPEPLVQPQPEFRHMGPLRQQRPARNNNPQGQRADDQVE
jgi:hypothetical protein